MNRLALAALVLALVTAVPCGSSHAQTESRQGPGTTPTAPKPSGTAPREKPVPPREVPPPPPDEPEAAGVESLPDYLYSTSQAIEFFEGRVRKAPRDFISYRILGEQYERRAAGEGGGLADFARAEDAFRTSLTLFPEYVPAQSALARVLCQRHKFAEALELAGKVRQARPGNHEALAVTADALIEMGRYDEGEKALAELFKAVQTAPVLARQANLAELQGRVDEADRLMRAAIAKVRQAGGTPEDLAWYQGRLGDFALTAGRLDEAERLYQAVPRGTDPFHDATAGRGRIAAIRGHLDSAITLYEKAVAIGPDPHMLAALGDLYLATGRKDKAEAVGDRLLKETEGKPEYLRDRARFLADHDRDLPQALQLARADFHQRQDVHGNDVLAWALFKNGQTEEAAKHSAEALKFGTRDPVLFYHSALIQDRLGNRAKAKEDLHQALALQPRFSVLHADAARKRLAELEQAVP